jgi:hypothetical protein
MLLRPHLTEALHGLFRGIQDQCQRQSVDSESHPDRLRPRKLIGRDHFARPCECGGRSYALR